MSARRPPRADFRTRFLPLALGWIGAWILSGSVAAQTSPDFRFAAGGTAGRSDVRNVDSDHDVRSIEGTVLGVEGRLSPPSQGQREGIAVSLMEAMAAGLPVVVSRIGGIPELVDLVVSSRELAIDQERRPE